MMHNLQIIVNNSSAPWISCFQGREKKTGEKHHSRLHMLGEQGRCGKAVDQSGGRGGTWVNVYWVCAAGLSEPLDHYSLFFGQL